MQNGDTGSTMGRSCGGESIGAIGAGRHMGQSSGSRCTKEGVSGGMRISEQPSDCLERGQAPLHHTLPYSVPPPLHMGTTTGTAHPHSHPHTHSHTHPGGFHCLQLHASHPHHPHHSHHHSDFFCPPPPAPLSNPTSHDRGPANLSNPDCQAVGGGGVGGGVSNAKDKVLEKNGGGGHHSNWQRKQQQHHQQQQQQHPYRKAEKAPDWLQPQQHHMQSTQMPHPAQQPINPHPQQHQVVRSRSAECINSGVDIDVFRSPDPKTGHGMPPPVNTSPFRDCSHQGPPPNASPLGNKAMSQHNGSVHSSAVAPGGGSCSLQRDGQKVARIRHQQHGRSGHDTPSPAELNQGTSQEMKRKMDISPYGYPNNTEQHQQPPLSPWTMRPSHHMSKPEEEQRKTYMELGNAVRPHTQQQQQQQQQPGLNLPHAQPPTAPLGPQQQVAPQAQTQGDSSATKALLKYSNQQTMLPSQKTPFGGLGSLKSAGGSCALQGNKHTLPPRKGPVSDGERSDCSGRSRDQGESGHGETEVRQPPVGIAVAVARQRDPPCRSGESHHNSRQGRVHPSVKGVTRSMYSSDPSTDEERKRMNGELTCLDRDRDPYIRENKERVEFSRMHPPNSCHGDLSSHLMVPGGTSLQSGQLGDPAAHSAHHWMPRTGSPSLWMTGHSYSIGHSALHQNLPPGFSAAMPGPLQPVLPLPQDPSQLVVLPTEPPAHPATHPLDVIEQPGLWPPVYGTRGPPSHMQHPAVYSRSQFLRQQELYSLQHPQLQHPHQHQSHQPQQAQGHTQGQLQQRPVNMDMQHQSTHNAQISKRPNETSELEELISEPRTPKPAKPYSYNPPRRNTPTPGAFPLYTITSQSTPSTPCPTPSPAAASLQSPAISPLPPPMSKRADSQEKSADIKLPQEYPESLEPDLPPGYVYPGIAIGYRNVPSTEDVQLAEPADLAAVQVEPVNCAPQSLTSLGEGLECQAVVRPLQEAMSPQKPMQEVNEDIAKVLEEREKVAEVTVHYVPTVEELVEKEPREDEVLICPPATSPVCEVASCPIPLSTEDSERPQAVITLDEEEGDRPAEESQVELARKVNMPEEQPSGLVSTSEPSPCSAALHAHELIATDNAEDKGPGMESDAALDASEDVLSPVFVLSPQSNQTEILPLKPVVPCYWSLELLIAAAFCTDIPPFPLFPFNAPTVVPSEPKAHAGMELLSELADLELQQQRQSCGKSQEEELLMFDLKSLATLATARALEMGHSESNHLGSERNLPARRIFNLRRKCSWTPRNEPVCPAKGSVETIDGPELTMRVKLAELQRHYKEKQRELAKLQRKHDHQKEETPRSPARRGPGRPRKRKPTLSSLSSNDGHRKIKSVGAGLALSPDHSTGDIQKRKKRLSSRGLELSTAQQIKAQGCKRSTLHGVLSSKLSADVAQLKQKAQHKKSVSGAGSRDKEASPCNSNPKHGHRGQGTNKAESRRESGGQSDTAASGDSGPHESWAGQKKGSRQMKQGSSQSGTKVLHDRESTPLETDSSEQDVEDEDGSDSDEGEKQSTRHQPSEVHPGSSAKGPSPSSIVKLEANQKARNKKQRQELYGSQNLPGVEGEVKVKKKPLSNTSKKRHDDYRPGSKLKEQRWGSLSTRGSRYRRTMGLTTFTTTTERLKRATRKNTILRGTINKRRSCWSAPSPSDEERSRRNKNHEPKGHAVSRLLESFAADEGFQMEGGSFSEEEEEYRHLYKNKSPDFPNCVLTKEMLTDGLKVLISKEDELLYAAKVHTLDIPDIFNILIDGERGNRPRIYSLEQLLQEAVLDVRPESEAVLLEGTRVCAYWSERSRCLYPGYVRRGGSDEAKPGVMVEFDDGDRGKISIQNIRLLPPGYQIQCGDSPSVPPPNVTTAKRSSHLEQAPINERPSNRLNSVDTMNKQTVNKRRPGRPKGSGKKQMQLQQQESKNSSMFLGWPMSSSRKRTCDNLLGHRRNLEGERMTCLFSSSSFEVDSFSSIANGYSSFCTPHPRPESNLSLGRKEGLYSQKRKSDEQHSMSQNRKSGQEFMVKLDHEGVMSPKTKNSKALLLRGASSSVSSLPRTEAYSHPVLLVKDNKKGGANKVELLLKGTSAQRKSSPSLGLRDYGDLGFSSHRECHSSYSDYEEEDERRRAAILARGLRAGGRFLSRLSVSSSSSGSSSSSSSGSMSSSSLCSSDNDSSYSSEDEDSSALMLQSCLSSRQRLLQTNEPTTSSRSHPFAAKAVATSDASSKSLKRKDCTGSKEIVKKPRMQASESSFIPRPKMSGFLAGRQMWRWSGNPTQVSQQEISLEEVHSC
ncbi:hypothetical protein WMY93_003114 [Mugilogobius chulae]|uniref:BAH domain-containing protein n=1 Tax=Mugilogobius chulae TaxID=88201 RepID=A0AAW0PVP7_9GOBI